ncbi:TIGR03663 family protein [Halobacteriales archaeon QS_9_70_65]|nr:MAG: TIGR03663 family protein [Halobacteriales archaeon QS_9_70_65]
MNSGDRTRRAVLAVTVVALVARFVLLGSRVAHYDEARVAWWGLEYLETGAVSYRYIIHGPLMQHLHRPLFAAFGASDFVMRAPVAAIGGLLPLVALWFRRHLDDVEVVGLASLLALDPVLLYYSRFARSTVFVAAFCFVSFAALVRWYDGDGTGYLPVAAVFLALGAGAKENAVVYVLCWLGAAALLIVGTQVRVAPPVGTRRRLWPLLADRVGTYRSPGAARRLVVSAAGAAAVLVAVVVFLYAPRGGEAGLWSGAPGATLRATSSDIAAGMEYWFGQGGEKDLESYRTLLERFVATSLEYAGVLVGLSVVGFLSELTRRTEARRVVLGCSYWGFASVVGYPLGTDIWGAWILVNALVPLAVPAAVGLGTLVDIGRESLTDDDRIGAAVVAVLLTAAAGHVAVVGVSAAFVDPTGPDNELVQFAQPQQELREPVDATVAVAERHEGDPDVLFYGTGDVTDAAGGTRSPERVAWFETLPWAWYLDGAGASVTAVDVSGDEPLPEDLPPVVVAEADCALERAVDCRRAPERLVVADGDRSPRLAERVPDDYRRYGVLHRSTGGNSFDGMVVYVDPAVAGQASPVSASRSQRGPARR